MDMVVEEYWLSVSKWCGIVNRTTLLHYNTPTKSHQPTPTLSTTTHHHPLTNIHPCTHINTAPSRHWPPPSSSPQPTPVYRRTNHLLTNNLMHESCTKHHQLTSTPPLRLPPYLFVTVTYPIISLTNQLTTHNQLSDLHELVWTPPLVNSSPHTYFFCHNRVQPAEVNFV